MRTRNKVISIRTTEIEYGLIKKLAAESKLSVTDYLIKCAMGKKINVIDIKPLYVEVKRIGNNVNQLARLANSERINEVNLSAVRNELNKIYSEIQKISKRCS